MSITNGACFYTQYHLILYVNNMLLIGWTHVVPSVA